jgi:hypothetical protein
MILTRRKLIGGLGLLVAAPAIVRAESLMKVRAHLDGMPTITYQDPPDLPYFPFQQYSGFDLFTGEHRKEFYSLHFITPTAAGESAA